LSIIRLFHSNIIYFDYFKRKTYLKERWWYLSAIDYLIIDTQVARRGRQYHSNPPPYKNRPTKATELQNIKQKLVKINEKKKKKYRKKKQHAQRKENNRVQQKQNRPITNK